MIETIAAWTGTSSLKHPERDVGLCRELGIVGLYVMVNDHSRSRRPRRFCLGQTRASQKTKRRRIIELADRCHEAGIAFHVTSWIMPHEEYIDEAAKALIPILGDTGADSLQFDTEEPWTRARDRMGRRLPQSAHAEAAEQISIQFKHRSCPMGATGIGYVSEHGRFAELANRCDYVVPQAYPFSMARAPEIFHGRYARFFGKEVRLGLRAYPEKTSPGLLGASMHAHWLSALETDATEAIYWSLSWIRKRKQAREFLAALRGEAEGREFVARLPVGHDSLLVGGRQ